VPAPDPDPSLPAALLWDMDGLLVDTEPTWTVAETELAGHLGGEWDDEVKAAVVGTRLDVAVPAILRRFGRPDTPAAVAETSAWLLNRMVELYRAPMAVRPGASALLAQAASAGVPQALVSSSFRVLVGAVLQHGPALGWAPFDLTLAGDEVRRGKPDPEPYRTAAARLGVPAERCVVLEDSPSGAASGLAAGCAVVAVPSLPNVAFAPAPRLRVAASLTEVTLSLLGALAGPPPS